MFNQIKKVGYCLINTVGWHTNRKLLVIESDDWGSIRMPSKEVYNKFLNAGIRVDNDPYCKYDSLATNSDLVSLFEVLTSVKDKNGNYAKFTANTIVANPDFEKIKESDYSQYYYEPFVNTLKKSVDHSEAFNMWKEGIRFGIFHPQFHGREHLNVTKWMKALRDNKNNHTKIAFRLGTFGLTHNVSHEIDSNYMGSFDSSLAEDIYKYRIIINEGLDLFEKIFGYVSESFIATCYTWSPLIEPFFKERGVKYLQGVISQRVPLDYGINFKYKNTNFQGTMSKSGLLYLMRNAFFEPAQHPNFDWINDCLKRITIAFKCHKPATISTHRLNFIGSIDESNKRKNLPLFQNLLKEIVRKWPDIEFLTSNDLGKLILNK